MVTAGNAGDASVAEALIDDLLDDAAESAHSGEAAAPDDDSVDRPTVYGDAAYGTGEFLDTGYQFYFVPGKSDTYNYCVGFGWGSSLSEPAMRKCLDDWNAG